MAIEHSHFMASSTSLGAPDYDHHAGYFHYLIATAAYCTHLLHNFTCTPCLATNASASELMVYQNASTDAHAFSAVLTAAQNSSDQRIVLSFRGTETLENWIENLKFAKTDRDMSCSGCKVHRGFVDVWHSTAAHVVPEMRRLRAAYPHAPLVVTGHSQGAGVATLGAYVLHVDEGIRVDGIWTYGGPRVGNPAFADFLTNSSINMWRVTHHRDPVVHLGFEWLGFKHSAREVFYKSQEWDEGNAKVCDGSGEDPDGANQYSVAYSVHDHLHYFGQTTGCEACMWQSPSAAAARPRGPDDAVWANRTIASLEPPPRRRGLSGSGADVRRSSADRGAAYTCDA